MRYNNIVKVNKTGGECLIGLEFVLGLYNMQHVELAEKLGIKKQNINMWVKQKQNIPKKYLPVLEELFQVNKDLLSRELTELEKLEIQKEKLKKDLQPVITKHNKIKANIFLFSFLKIILLNPFYIISFRIHLFVVYGHSLFYILISFF